MEDGHYNVNQIADYWDWAVEKLVSCRRCDFFVETLWSKVWDAAERETAANRVDGKFNGANSLGLLRLKTEAAVLALDEAVKRVGWSKLYRWEPDFSTKG